jgi:hypothetical protein
MNNMSAWLTGNKGISIVVDVLRENHYKDNKISDNEMFAELLAINLASLIARYGDIGYDWINAGYNNCYTPMTVSEGQKIRTCHSYMYQSCEINNFEDIEIIAFLQKVLSSDKYQKIEKETEDEDLEWDIDNPMY